MRAETFRGRTLSGVLARIRAERGDDARIVGTRSPDETGDYWEVSIAADSEIESVRARLMPKQPQRGANARRYARASHLIAFVGAPGVGKTTSLAKVAVHGAVYGGERVALLSLDTYRVGALEQIRSYADVAGLPLEIAYDAGDLPGALRRLEGYDTILVDTPGRKLTDDANLEWRALLRELSADEVHFVVPAGVRMDVALAMKRAYEPCGLTHALITKLDEVPAEAGVGALAEAMGLPMRWVCDGQEVPFDLRPALPRVLSAFAEAPMERAS